MIPILNRFGCRHLFTSSLRKADSQEPLDSMIAEGSFKLWRSILFFAAIPAIMLCALNCVIKHKEESDRRPKFIKYNYLCIRTKRFPWGDGSKSFFHNPKLNALPNGYEDETAVI